MTQEPNAIVAVDVRSLRDGGSLDIETYDDRRISMSVKLAKEILPCGKNATTMELATFLCWCQANKLDPIRKQAHLIKYSANDAAAFVVSYWVYVERAQIHAQFDGMETGIVWDAEGVREWLSPCKYAQDATHLIVGGWAKVWRKDREHIFQVEVPWCEMAKTKRDGSLTKNWKDQGTTMAQKVPLSRALRLAFAEDLGGTYTDAEWTAREEISDEERTKQLEDNLDAGDKTAADYARDAMAGEEETP